MLFTESIALYPRPGPVPDDEDFTLPIGRADIKREGGDVTLVSFAAGVHWCLRAARALSQEGIECEVVDLRWLRPLDMETVIASFQKTNRCVVVEESLPMYSLGSEIAARLQEAAFDYMDAPIKRVSAADVPLPFARDLELMALPDCGQGGGGGAGGFAMSAPIQLTVAGILLNWLAEVGDTVQAGDVVAEIEADKATVEIEAPANGILSAQSAGPGDELAEGETIGMIALAGEPEPTAPAATAPPVNARRRKQRRRNQCRVPGTPASVAEDEDDWRAADARLPAGVRASPVARKMAAERGIDLARVQGSGPGGRIVKADIENYTPAQPATDIAAAEYEDQAIGRMRQRIGEGTARSKREAPHFYVTVEVSVEALLALRRQWNESQPAAQRLSVNDCIVKAAALTLRDFPNLNAHYLDGRLRYFSRRNIGISVALEGGGLINVVATDADLRSIGELARENREMIARARDGRIRPTDILGATFTISNLGPFGVLEFSAIIDPPQAAILAVSSARREAIIRDDGSIGAGERMRMTLSVDHRVSDGAEAARFLQQLSATLEAPLPLFLPA